MVAHPIEQCSLMADHLDSKNLVPFKRKSNGYHLPFLGKEQEQEIIDQVDPDLRPEEQRYVRHFLAYADTFLKNAKEEAPDAEVEGSVDSTGAAGETPVDGADVKDDVEVSEQPSRKKNIA